MAGGRSSNEVKGPGSSNAQWTLWQLCDSGLPTGGFAHSGGLEAAAAQGIVKAKHTGSLLRFVRGVLANAASLQLPLVMAAFRGETLDAWVEVDSVAHACITGEAARRASLAQGAGLLRAAQAMFPLGEHCGQMIGEFRGLVRGAAAFPATENEATAPGSARRVARGHHAPAFGVVCRALGIETSQAMRAFMFLVARDVLSAATRLSLLGPLEAGRLMNGLSGFTETLVVAQEGGAGAGVLETARKAEGQVSTERGVGVESYVCQVDPVQDIVQGLHDRLYSRMFNS